MEKMDLSVKKVGVSNDKNWISLMKKKQYRVLKKSDLSTEKKIIYLLKTQTRILGNTFFKLSYEF